MDEINWDLLAQSLEFSTPQEMFQHWYIEQHKTISQISDIVEVDQKEVIDGLVVYDIVPRTIFEKRSGHRPGIFTCRYCNRQYYGDVRNVCCLNEECIEKHKQAEKRDKYKSANKHNIKRRKKVSNGCIICGRNKGINKWYCRDCLSGISTGAMFD